VNTSDSETSPSPRTRTTHVLSDETEIDYEEVLR
jgi:hypothetical protein